MEKELGRKVNISGIHVAIKRMSEKGFVSAYFGGINQERGGRRNKYYVITAAGKEKLDQQYALRTSMYQKIPNISFG